MSDDAVRSKAVFFLVFLLLLVLFSAAARAQHYGPDRSASRAEMTVFLTRMFNLPLP